MQRWEYMTVRIPSATSSEVVIALLNDYGQGGWELISVHDETRFWFKRQIKSEDDARR